MKKVKINTKIQVILIVVALVLGSIFVINKLASGKIYASDPLAVCPADNPNCSGGISVDSIVINATCTVAGKKNIVCSTCSGIVSANIVIPATGHNYKTISQTSATCTTPGSTTSVCGRCGDTKVTESPATGHKEIYVSQNDGTHVKKCKNCNKVIAGAFNCNFKTKSETPATCVDSGSHTEVCQQCGYEKETVLPATGHKEIYVSQNDGTHVKKCENCNKVIAGEFNCNFKTESEIPATCVDSGSRTEVCEQCGYKKETVLPATGHIMPSTGTAKIDSTCVEKGYEFYPCDICGTPVIVQTFELADHKYIWESNQNGTHTAKCSVCGKENGTKSCTNFTTITYPATCLYVGYNRSVCRVCGYTKTITLPALGHEYGQDGKCTRCGTAKPTTPGGDPTPNPGDGGDTKLELSGITIYQINDKYMTNVKINTKASELIKTIQDANEGATVTIFNSNNEAVSEDEILATGMRIEVTIGDTKYDITIVVKGDTNGDGKAELSDIIKMNKHRLNKSQLGDAYLQAADVDSDGKVNLLDIIKLNKFRLNKITEL